jgi:hypothetical protein
MIEDGRFELALTVVAADPVARCGAIAAVRDDGSTDDDPVGGSDAVFTTEREHGRRRRRVGWRAGMGLDVVVLMVLAGIVNNKKRVPHGSFDLFHLGKGNLCDF